MIAVVQRVIESAVWVDGKMVAKIGKGLNILIGMENMDEESKLEKMAKKCIELRIFEDEQGKMSKSVIDVDGEVIIISQFTLAGDVSKGRRPDFTNALKPEKAKLFYDSFITYCKRIIGEDNVKSGVFGADMKVSIFNDGPVTMIIKL
ncbi:MAG: D-aminoacyl-tRNA deacylase [Calditerrivibrio sp.]|nr:D-aminoacyl-tRNA deacylase [Calditerrivibrio sp.]